MKRVFLAGRPRVVGGWRRPLKAPRRAMPAPKLSGIATRSDLRAQMPPVLDQGCHDDKTEVLTEHGWTPWTRYDGRSLLGTMNQTTGLLEFQEPTAITIGEHDGPMYYSDHRSLDFALTPGHRMLQRRWDENARTLSADFTFRRIDELGWYAGLPHATAGFVGAHLGKIRIGEREYDGDDFVALVALLASDGWVGGTESNWNTVSFCCFRDDRIEMVRGLARRLGLHEVPSRPGVWKWADGALATWFRANAYTANVYRSPFKRVPDIIKSVDGDQVALFLRFFGDQHIGNSRHFYTSSDHLAGDLQELLLRVGRRGTICDRPTRDSIFHGGRQIGADRDGKDITIVERTSTRLSLERKKQLLVDHYKGPIFCATVPNSTLITRRNGSILISGNSVGSCTAFAALENREHLTIRSGAPRIPFSRLYLYARTRQREGTALSDDAGATVADAFEVLEDLGACPAELWPDEPEETRFALNPPTACDVEAEKHQVLMAFSTPTLATIRASLTQGFPVGFGFWVPANMMSAECAATGIVHLPRDGEGFDGGHAVTAVGHDDTFEIDGKRGALLCQNHWGRWWGQSGFFWLPYGYFERGLADDAHTMRRAD